MATLDEEEQMQMRSMVTRAETLAEVRWRGWSGRERSGRDGEGVEGIRENSNGPYKPGHHHS